VDRLDYKTGKHIRIGLHFVAVLIRPNAIRIHVIELEKKGQGKQPIARP
jgi:hypothetical protein